MFSPCTVYCFQKNTFVTSQTRDTAKVCGYSDVTTILVSPI